MSETTDTGISLSVIRGASPMPIFEGEYGFLNEIFRPRSNGREFEWRDISSGRYFVIKYNKYIDSSRDISIVTISLRDIRDKSIFDLPSGSKNSEKPTMLSLWVSAVDDQDQFADDVPDEELSYMTLVYETDGERQKPHGFNYGYGSKFEFKARGHYDYSALPSRINFDKTVEAFREQLLSGDFSTPELLE